MNFRNGPIGLLFHTLFILFILAPIVMVCAVAFTSEGFISLPSGAVVALVPRHSRQPALHRGVLVQPGAGHAVGDAGDRAGGANALALARNRFRGREALVAFFLSPLMIPHVVLGLAFLKFFTTVDWPAPTWDWWWRT